MFNQLEVQKYLRGGHTLDELEKEFGIYHRVKNGKVVFSYDHLFSPMKERICQECRGLILKENTWEAICVPFFKFHNYGEGLASKIDWNSARILEKIDGSNLNLALDPFTSKFCFSTRGMAEAEGLCESGQTYSEIAFLALKEMGINWEDFEKLLNKDYTYIFELVSPYTQVHIFYETPTLYLLAVRDNLSLKEIDHISIAKKLGVPVPKSYPLMELDKLVELVNSWKGTEQEGVVVCDANFNRVKVKNLDYVHGQHLVHKMAASDRNIMVVVVNGNYDDLLSRAPSFVVDKISHYKAKLLAVKTICEYEWYKYKDIESMKEYAFAARTCLWDAYMFSMKRNKIESFNEMIKGMIVSNQGIDKLIEMCGKVK